MFTLPSFDLGYHLTPFTYLLDLIHALPVGLFMWCAVLFPVEPTGVYPILVIFFDCIPTFRLKWPSHCIRARQWNLLPFDSRWIFTDTLTWWFITSYFNSVCSFFLCFNLFYPLYCMHWNLGDVRNLSSRENYSDQITR